MIGNISEDPDFDIGPPTPGAELLQYRRIRAEQLGGLALRIASAVDMGVRVGLSVAALTGSLFAGAPGIATGPATPGAGKLPNISEMQGGSQNTNTTTDEVTVGSGDSADSETLPNTGS